MTTDKLICAVELGKYEGATFVIGEEYIMESTFLAKLFIRVWFNVVTEYLYLHALLFPIEFLDLAGLGGVKGCWSDTGYMLSSGREGAASLIVNMEDRSSADCPAIMRWEPPTLLYPGTGSMWWRLNGGMGWCS